MGRDGTRSGWLTDNGASLAGQVGAAAVDWRVADCMPGDVVVLGECGRLHRYPAPAAVSSCPVKLLASAISEATLQVLVQIGRTRRWS